MEDPERRVRQLLVRHIVYRAHQAGYEPLDAGSCHQVVALIRLWEAAGDEWDQPEAFKDFDHLMANLELGGAAPTAVSDEELLTAARAVEEVARTLS